MKPVRILPIAFISIGFRNCIVLIRETSDTWDYGFYKEAEAIMSKS